MGNKKQNPKKAPRRAGGRRLSMMELAAPAVAAALGTKALLKFQDLPANDTAKAKSDKTPLMLAGAAYYLTTTKYRGYASAVLVLAAQAYKRKLAMEGKLSSDPASSEMLLADDTPSPKK